MVMVGTTSSQISQQVKCDFPILLGIVDWLELFFRESRLAVNDLMGKCPGLLALGG